VTADDRADDGEDAQLEIGRAVLAAQPFSVLLGAELTSFGDGAARLAVPLRDDLRQQNGYAHGGVLSYAADNAITFAAGSVVGPEVLTAEVKITYLSGARGERVEAAAEVVHVGSRLVTVRCDIHDVRDGERALSAVALGSVAVTGRAGQDADG
jgi:uncharacterized protein (TIGR00369 family)